MFLSNTSDAAGTRRRRAWRATGWTADLPERLGVGLLGGLSLYLCLGCLCLGCHALPNYEDPAGPRYVGDYVTAAPETTGTFRVVTFNIKHGESVAQAIHEIQSDPNLAAADAYLLQEMDPAGVDEMASALQCRYVYYPSAVSRHGRDWGTAVLSPWPMSADAKIILPHYGPLHGELKASTRVTLALPDTTVTVYSMHAHTPWLGPRGYLEQCQTVLDDAGGRADPVIVAGDFNTVGSKHVDATAELFAQADFVWASEAAGNTASGLGLSFTLDLVFASNMHPIDSGSRPTEASDHRPVWATLSWDAESSHSQR